MSPATERDREDHDEERATRGVARSLRTWLPRLVVVAIVGVFVWSALRGSDGPGGPGDEDAGGESAPDDGSDAETTDPSASADATDTQSPDVPADVEEGDRPPVDLSQAPDSADAMAVARWWGAAYVRWSGAEPPTALAERLAGVTTPEYRAALEAESPAASYGEPVEVVGVSGLATPETASTAAASGPPSEIQVTVETMDALLVYDVVLHQDAAGAWLVHEATVV
jgi:hypothetical protein